MAGEAKADLQQRFGVEPVELEPRVYYCITDNWLERTVRFIVGTHRIRGMKDAMSQAIVVELDKAGIGIASTTYDIVGLPPIEIHKPLEGWERRPDPRPFADGGIRSRAPTWSTILASL